MIKLLMPLAMFCALSQVMGKDLKEAEGSVKFLEGKGSHCTAFTVAVTRWLTEAHCIVEGEMVIDDQHARILKIDKDVDLALLEGPIAPPLPIAKREPELGEAVVLVGWAEDWPFPNPLTFYGHVSALDNKIQVIDYPAKQMNSFHEGGGQGMSGGPILNGKGEVVGISEALEKYPSILVYSPTVKEIRKFLGLK